jgi:hypothetical protein
MFMLVVAPMRAVGVSRALMEVVRRGSAINGFFARETLGADCTRSDSRVATAESDFLVRALFSRLKSHCHLPGKKLPVASDAADRENRYRAKTSEHL